MKRPFIYLSLILSAFLILIVIGEGVRLIQLSARLHPAIGWVVGLILAGVLLAGLLLIAFILPVVLGRFDLPEPGSRRHQRYITRLASRHRRHPVINLDGLPADDTAFLKAAYRHLDEQTATLITSTAETIFFHTAISQSGHMDALVALSTQMSLARRLARLYHPRPGWRVLFPLYTATVRALLLPSNRDEVNLGAQIGPAIVGASVVGAIPGANLVSLIIADAVIQGSANALATFRTGLLARRYFHHRLEGGPFRMDTERRIVNQEALELLSRLVSTASGALSRTIWDAAKDSLRRMPAATYDSLKSLVSRSVRELGRKKGDRQEDKGSDHEDVAPTEEGLGQ